MSAHSTRGAGARACVPMPGVCALVCALAGAPGCDGGCDEKRPDAEQTSARPTLVVERTPGRPIARRPAPRTTPSARQKPGPYTQFARVQGESYSGWLRPVTSSDHFRPSEANIAALELALPASFAAAVERGDVPAGLDVTSYVRQYAGYHARAAHGGDPEPTGGEPIVEIKLFCPESAHLAGQFLQVKGGGDCFITTAYELRTGRFRYWRVSPE